MPDMLVKLYRLPKLQPALDAAGKHGVTIRRAKDWEKPLLERWIREHFTDRWAWEAAASFKYTPVKCYLAVEGDTLLGFAVWDCSAMNFFAATSLNFSRVFLDREPGKTGKSGKKTFL